MSFASRSLDFFTEEGRRSALAPCCLRLPGAAFRFGPCRCRPFASPGRSPLAQRASKGFLAAIGGNV